MDAKTAATEAEVERCAEEAKNRHAAICDRLGAMSQFVWPYVVRPQVESRTREREAWARLVTATKRVGAESKLGDPALFAAAIVEYEKARDALSALGVDVDTLLEAA